MSDISSYEGMILKIVRQKYSSDATSTSEYWIVTGPPRPSLASRVYANSAGQTSHPVQRCTKTGKRFKDTNGFDGRLLKDILENNVIIGKPGEGGWDWKKDFYLIRRPGNYENEKVNNEHGIKVTALKNRISYLEGRIANDTKLLAKAKEELSRL